MNKKRWVSLLAVTMVVTTNMPNMTFAADFQDIKGHWAESEIDEWSSLGIIQGYNEKFEPNKLMTRGDFAVVLDKLMKYQEIAENTFTDLNEKYYTQALLKANCAKVITGDGQVIKPESKITREEAITILARAFHIPIKSGNTNFADDEEISAWAKDYVKTLQELGYIQGKENNKFEPSAPITRAEVIKLFDNLTSKIYNTKGDYSQNIVGNVVVNSEDVKLNNMTIDGDLIIAEGVGDGEVYLDKVNITGDVYIKGGGENSVYFNSTTVSGSLIVNKVDGAIRIVATGETKAKLMILESGATVITKEIAGGGIDKVVIPANLLLGQDIVLKGDFSTVENNAKDLSINVEGSIKELSLNVDTEIKGKVKVDKVNSSENVGLKINGKVVEEDTKKIGGSGNSGSSGSSGSSGNSGETNKLSISFEGNGAISTPQAISISKGEIAQLPLNPEKEHHFFMGWYTDDKFTTLFDVTKPITSDITLYAKWGEKSSITTGSSLVIFESNGGNLATPIEVINGQVAPELPIPTKKDCEFLGWYIDPKLTELFNKSEPIMKDITLYAKWTGWQAPVAIDERFEVGYPKVEIIDGIINLKVKLKENADKTTKVFMVVNQINSGGNDVDNTSIIEGRVGTEDSLIYVDATPYLEIANTEEYIINTSVDVLGYR